MSLLDLAPAAGTLTADEREQLVVLGQQFTVRVTAAQTGGAFYAFDLVAPPGIGVPAHVHDREDELFVVNRGTARFVVDGREILACAGDSVFGPRGVPHAWEAIGDEPLEAFVLVTPGNLADMFRDLGGLKAIDFPRIAAICAPHGVRFV